MQIAAQTLGWVSVMISPDDYMMTNGDTWVAIVDDTTGEVQVQDRWSTGIGIVPDLNENQDLVNSTGYQTDTMTIVSFSRLLDTGDVGKDKGIFPGYQGFSFAFDTMDAFVYHDPNNAGLDFVVWADTTPPAVPLPPVATQATNTSISLLWQTPINNGSSDLISFTLQMDDGQGGPFITILEALTLTYSIDSLLANTPYQFRLSASNSDGVSAFSWPVAISTLPDDYQLPDVPLPPTAPSISSGSVVLNWLPVDSHNIPLLSYTVQMAAPKSDFQDIYTGLDLSTTVNDLEASTTYSFRLRATSLAGDSDWSTSVSFTTSSCPNACSGSGTCVLGLCQCFEGFLGIDCSIPGANRACFDSENWCLNFKVDGDFLYVSMVLSPLIQGWAGFIIGQNGDGMSNGDTWIVGFDSINRIVLQNDMFAYSKNTPALDSQQDLQDVVAYVDSFSNSIVRFKRLLVTGDVMDTDIVEGTTRISWAYNSYTYSLAIHNAAGAGTIDFFSGIFTQTDNSMPPYIYLPVGGAVAFVIFVGLILNTDQCRQSSLGTCLTFRKVGSIRKPTTCDRLTMDFWPNFVDLSIAELFVVLIYLAAMGGLLYLSHDEYTTTQGSEAWTYAIGQLSVVQLSFVMLPVTRNSLWVYVFGIPFERAIKFHRWVARLAVAGVVVHGVLFVNSRGLSVLTDQTKIEHGENALYGFLAGLCFLLAAVLAFEPIRRLWFEVFYHSHFIVFPGLAFAWLHSTYFRNFIYPPIALYALDRMVRFYRSHIAVQVLSTRLLANGTEGQVSELWLKCPSMRFSPGDYCFIRIPQISLLEWHPFSISSAPSALGDGRVRFHCLDMGRGTWTGKLAALLRENNGLHDDIPAFNEIYVDGPYGRLTMPLESYSVIILVAGGVGVTPMMSILQDMWNKRHMLKTVSAIHFVWANRHHEAFTDWFPDFLKEVNGDRESKFYLHLYWTDRKNRPKNLVKVPVSANSLKNRNVLGANQDLPELGSSGKQPSHLASATTGRVGRGRPSVTSLLPSLNQDGEPTTPVVDSSRQTLLDGAAPVSEHHQIYRPEEDPLADVADLPIDRMHRPDYPTLFDVFMRNADRPGDVAVYACGPQLLIESAQVAALERGFAFHKETFFL